MSPSQAAYLRAEQRRIDDYFVTRVASITGATSERVRAAMPDRRRITVTVERMISAIESDLGRPLSADQRAAIIAADARRKASLTRVREGASQR